jgi:hypothetical protein
MKRARIIFGILIATFILASCEKEITFNGEISKPLIVVNSYITTDSVISAHISESKFFLSDGYTYNDIDNATVALTVNGVFKENLKLEKIGIYRGTYKPVEGDLIRLVVKAPTKNDVSCEAKMDAKPEIILPIDTSSVTTDTRVDYGYYYFSGSPTVGDTLAIITSKKINYTLKFKDNGDVKNYYRLVVLTKEFYSDAKITKDSVLYNYYFSFDDIVSGNNSNNDPMAFSGSSYNLYNVFSDELFNGKDYPLTFSTNVDVYHYMPNYKHGVRLNSRIEVNIFLQSISRDYYLYLKSRQAASDGNGLFSEPVQIHNNIEGGIGILGSYTSNMTKIDL